MNVYDASAHEPLTETPWDEGRVDEQVAAIVEEAESALDGDAWPIHPLDADDDDPPRFMGIYLGTAGMLWALGRLGSSLDLRALAAAALAGYRELPDSGEHAPGLWMGESGVLLAARAARLDSVRRGAARRARRRERAQPDVGRDVGLARHDARRARRRARC